MARFNADFWEIPTKAVFLENTPAEKALWFETEEDRDRRHALEEFFQSVLPAVQELISAKLTGRQQEILRLYFFEDMTQEDIAEALSLSQSTVSRHLFGTTRNGKKVGGAIPKLRKVVDKTGDARIHEALATLKTRFGRAHAA